MIYKEIKSSYERVFSIFSRDFFSYFNSPVAYIFVGSFLIVANWMFFQSFFLSAQASMRPWFSFLPWIIMFVVPALTMRSWAEEKKSGTIEILLTLPIKDFEAVLGKFLSSFCFLLVTIVLSLSVPFTVGKLGDMDIGITFSGYIGTIFLLMMYVSIGLFVSSISKNQIAAFLITLFLFFVLHVIGIEGVSIFFGSFSSILKFFSSSSHFEEFAKGMIDSRDIFYFISFTFLFLYLNAQSLGSRNWR